jgi:ELWxxDGT repeat protein
MWRPRPSLLMLLLLSPWGFLSRPAHAQVPGEPAKDCGKAIALVKDIAQPGCTASPCTGSVPNGMVEMGGVLYFQAFDGEQGNGGSGSELWRSDGTSGGTSLVKDIATQPSNPNSNPRDLTVVHGKLFFVADDNGMPALWMSDGTEAGTQRVRGIDSDESEMELTALSSTLFFKMKGAGGSTTLWTSDGTAGGTREVRAENGVNYSNPQFLTPLENKLYFQAQDARGAELWRSDGTPAGTFLVKDVLPGGDGSPSDLTVANGELFFRAIDTPGGDYRLWRSSGSAENTEPVPGITSSGFLENLTAAGNSLFFTLTEGPTVLWAYHRGEGAKPLRNFSLSLTRLTQVDRWLFFMHGNELWKSDGTKPGTQLVMDFGPTSISLIAPGPGMAVLVASTPTGYALWKSNGERAGTVPMDEYPYGPFPSPTTSMVSAAKKLFFVATQHKNGLSTEPLVGDELFAMDFKKVDCTAPRITCAAPMTLEALSPGGAWAQYLPPASTSDDSLSPVMVVKYQPAAGTFLPISGASSHHIVEVTAEDAAGNPATCELKVSVVDGTDPLIRCPTATLYAEATEMQGARVFFPVTADDAASKAQVVFLDQSENFRVSGEYLPVGRTEIMAIAQDEWNNRSSCKFSVEVKDRMPPSLQCPGPQAVTVRGPDGGPVKFAKASAQDNAGPPEVSYSPGQGSLFPPGETVVTATATDAEGNTASCTFPVTVTVEAEGEGPDEPEEGCGCRSGGLGASVVWLVLALFPAWTRRRAGRLGV